MSNAIFTTKVEPVYDDLPEFRYHFPSTYLNQAEKAVGDWIIYYEPRREGLDLAGRAGRQSYFATARLDRIEVDPTRVNHYYGYVSKYLEFDEPVRFKSGDVYPESKLQKSDGSTNKGLFGRSIRLLSAQDFQRICQLGFTKTEQSLNDKVPKASLNDEPALYRTRRTILAERAFRDAAFTKVIQKAYESTCAMTGLKLINGGGRCEIEAAHIRPVEKDGPDSPRNGIALSRTVHWMFDRGILSVSQTGSILMAKKLVPEPVLRMLNPDGLVKFPTPTNWIPHQMFFEYHRENIFKGN